MKEAIRGISCIVSVLLVFAIFSTLTRVDGALRKPTYAAGDKWVYVLSGSLAGLPGFNTSQGTFHLGRVGFVYVNVIGSATVQANNTSVSAIRVDSPATGFLKCTCSVPRAVSGKTLGSSSAT